MSFSRTCRNAVVTIILALSPLGTSVAETSRDGFHSTAAFLSHSRLHDWLADGERGLWVQADDLRWFYAGFAHPCHGLSATNSVDFDTRGSGHIDSGSAVVVPGSGRCTFLNFVPSHGPPKDRNANVVPEPQAQ
jgi:hypothetical protein